MLRSTTLALFSAAILSLAGPAAAADEAAVTGTVVDEAGAPVAGAVVEPAGNRKGLRATTAADGSFRLPLGYPARDEYWAELHVRERPDGGRMSYVLESGQGPPPPLRVVLKPARELSVRVVDGRGGPVADADVWFLTRVAAFTGGKTDASGRWSGPVPADTNHWAVLARKGGVGFDFATANRWKKRDEPQPVPEAVTLTLAGSRTLRVRTVDREGRPVAGVPVGPASLQFEGRPDFVSLTHVPGLWPATDADGLAEIDWLPSTFLHDIAITADPADLYPYYETRIRPDDGVDQVEILLLPDERLAGRVVHADGTPAEGVTVTAVGSGVGPANGTGSARTGADGRYEMRVRSEQAYLVSVGDERWSAPFRTDAIVRPGRPAEGIDFTLVPVTRLRGRVTVGRDDRPVPDASIYVSADGGPVPEEIEALRREGDTVQYGLHFYRSARTDADGRYELLLGPGEYAVRGPAHTEPTSVSIPADAPPAEVVRDFTMARPESGRFTLTVVDGDGRPVPGAEVTGYYRGFSARHDWHQPIETDAEGRLRVERSLDPVVLRARTKDRGLAGIIRSDAEETRARLVVAPTASASGRLLDKRGAALAGKDLRYAVRVHSGPEKDSPWTNAFGGAATTDGEGRFTLAGLVPGETYHLTLKVDESLSRGVTTVTAATARPLDLGDLEVDPDPIRPYVPPTPEKRLADALAAKADLPLPERIEGLLAEAGREYTRPLLLFARPGDPAAVELYRLLYEDREAKAEDVAKEEAGEEAGEGDAAAPRPKTPRELRWEFELAALDMTKPGVPEFGGWLGVKNGDADPPVLATTDFGDRLAATFPLTRGEDGKLDRDALAGFLASQKLPTRDAEGMLSDALAKAKAEDKRVFLVASASWCGPCRMLARYLAPFKPELEKHFVFVKLDVSRDEHGGDVSARHRRDREGGVPWFVILDADGNELSASNMPASAPEFAGENIGFPSEPACEAYFLEMLRAAAPRLDGAALDAMKAALEGD